MRRLLPLLCVAWASAWPGMASAAALPPLEQDGGSLAAQPLFVELLLNGQQSGDIVQMTLRDGQPLIAAADLRKAGLMVTGDGPIDVETLPGVHARYDAAAQTLQIDAAANLLPTHHLATAARPREATVADVGAMLNYDFYAQTAGGETSVSVGSEQRVFGPFGTFSNTGTLRWASGRGAAKGYLRYDTRYHYADENNALTYSVGDIITQSLPWTTSVRMGGIQIARDYRVRPDLVTYPLPSFAGQTAVPSAVDLFVDGYRQQGAQNVAPGPFTLDSMPVVNGAGEATIVTTDAVGRQVSTTIPFYVAPDLLRPGLFDVAGEIGFLRRGYGLRNFDYGRAAASGTLRRGLTKKLTIEAHAEATRGLALAGGGLVWAPGLWGTLDLSGAASHSNGQTGTQLTAGYSYTTRRFTVALEHTERSTNYRDLGSFDLNDYVGTRRSDRAVASMSFGKQGTFGVAYIDGRTLAGPRTQIGSVSYSRPIGRLASLFLTADHDFRAHTTSAQLRLVIPFGRNSLNAGLSHDPSRGAVAEVDYTHSVPNGGGLGYNGAIASDEHGNAYGQANAVWRGRAVEVQAGGSYANGQTSGYVGATGSIVTMDRDVFAANQVPDAFAVVSTGGVAGVPISYENQPVGVTDHSGHVFVPSITSYHTGHFAIDPLALGTEDMAATVERDVSLRAGVGAIVHMTVRRVHSATVTLVDRKGAPLEPGGRVSRKGATDAEIGWDGVAFLEDLAAQTVLDITRQDGTACHATVALPANAPPLAQIGPVPCV